MQNVQNGAKNHASLNSSTPGGKRRTDLRKLKPQDNPNSNYFWERSIDDVIDSVNSSETDRTLKDDASLSQELKSGRIPLEMNAAVQKWIEYFSGRDRERYQRFLNRGETYRPMIMAVLKDQGIPPEIYYQAMIESGFTVHATSHAQAVGIWQFIRPTGKRYGLRINSSIDERRDPVRATVAASLYLRDLYNVFQSWYLAMAAYNAGEGRILNAIMKAKTRDFWEMARRRQLPSETMDYIPKFLAAAIIGHNPEKYGFTTPPAFGTLKLASIEAPSGRSLADIAEAVPIPLAVLKEHNPHLLRSLVPSDSETYRLWVPSEFAAATDPAKLARLPLAPMAPSPAEPRSANHQTAFHRVKRGETLEKISREYQMSLSELKALNRLKSNNIIIGQRLRVHAFESDDSASAQNFSQRADMLKYTVQRGDSLAQVARKFGISISELKKINQLRHHKIYAGQILQVTPKG